MTSREFNETGFEDNVFLDPVEEAAQPPDHYHWHLLFYIEIIGDVIKLLVYLAAIVSDVYIITILAKFKTLRNRINNLILIYAILNMLFLVLGTLILTILSIGTSHIGWYRYYCLTNNIDYLMVTLSFYVLTFLATIWYMLNYHPELCSRFRRVYKDCIVTILIVLAILQWIIHSVFCFDGSYNGEAFRFAFEGTSFTVCGIILLCLSILKRFREPVLESFKTEYALSIPLIVFSFSLPYYVIRLLIVLSKSSFPESLYLLELFAQSLFFLPPILVLYLLGKSNKYFKMGYLKCCKRHARNYNDDDLDSGSSAEPVQSVALEKDPEVIRF